MNETVSLELNEDDAELVVRALQHYAHSVVALALVQRDAGLPGHPSRQTALTAKRASSISSRIKPE